MMHSRERELSSYTVMGAAVAVFFLLPAILCHTGIDENMSSLGTSYIHCTVCSPLVCIGWEPFVCFRYYRFYNPVVVSFCINRCMILNCIHNHVVVYM